MKYKQKRYLSINFLFHTHKNTVGDFQLLVRIRMGRENSFSMPIGIKIKKKLWDWKTELISAKHPNAKIYNKKMLIISQRDINQQNKPNQDFHNDSTAQTQP